MSKIINLLPKEKQKELGFGKIYKTLLSLIWISAMSFVLVFLVLVSVRAYLGGQESHLTASIQSLKEQTGKEENAAIKAQVKALNDLVADHKALSKAIPKQSKVLRAFTPIVPPGVKVTSLRMDAGKKIMDINGYAPTRESVIKLYESLVKDSKNFSNVDYPLENVAKPTDINFHFSFSINEALLK
jgi:Tfp pilus assembly protein PilN